MAFSCTRGSLGWTLGNTSLQKELLSTGIGSLGKWFKNLLDVVLGDMI